MARTTKKNRVSLNGLTLIEEVVQRRYVSLGHLQSFVLGELPVLAQLRKESSQSVESLIQVLHPTPFSGIRRQTSLPQNQRSHATLVPPHGLGTGSFVVVLRVAVVTRRRRRSPVGGHTLRGGRQHVHVAVGRLGEGFHFLRISRKLETTSEKTSHTTERRFGSDGSGYLLAFYTGWLPLGTA